MGHHGYILLLILSSLLMLVTSNDTNDGAYIDPLTLQRDVSISKIESLPSIRPAIEDYDLKEESSLSSRQRRTKSKKSGSKKSSKKGGRKKSCKKGGSKKNSKKAKKSCEKSNVEYLDDDDDDDDDSDNHHDDDSDDDSDDSSDDKVDDCPCDDDLYLCPDGITLVSRNETNNCEFRDCPEEIDSGEIQLFEQRSHAMMYAKHFSSASSLSKSRTVLVLVSGLAIVVSFPF